VATLGWREIMGGYNTTEYRHCGDKEATKVGHEIVTKLGTVGQYNI